MSKAGDNKASPSATLVERLRNHGMPHDSSIAERCLEAADALAQSETTPTEHTEYLRQLLIGLECQGIDKLLSEKQDPLLFRYLGERITCSAKAGAALGVGIAPEEA